MNRGSLLGSTQPQIQFYEPTMICAANSGTPTHPSLTRVDGHSYQFGRFVQLSPSLVYVEIQLQFLGAQADSTGAVGSGGVYCISLPPEFPLKRTNPGQIERTPLSPGTGMSYLSFGSASVPDVNVECVPVAADPWATLNGQEDSYFSAMVPYGVEWGSNSIGAALTVSTINHPLGYAFNAYDVDTVTFKATSTQAIQHPYIDTITTTQFNVNVRQIPSTNGVNFDYKVRAEPATGQAGALMSPTMPWDWTKVTSITPFGNFFFTLLYETVT